MAVKKFERASEVHIILDGGGQITVCVSELERSKRVHIQNVRGEDVGFISVGHGFISVPERVLKSAFVEAPQVRGLMLKKFGGEPQWDGYRRTFTERHVVLEPVKTGTPVRATLKFRGKQATISS